ncbi:uncharacterized protein LOC132048826 [Lycium ferocissimum]|uniref:uncharacterized protein LOC132048826 n=1 Tax=Lycium ferocissimum TaxID=112874 RepID=UPI002814A076|nr:uncharacterized protein LOC132048826 [Lycium ferocissimum]
MNFPWLIGGDFKVIMNDEEKIGGFPVYPNEYEDFAFCMNSCELNEVGFRGSPFTWWNGRAGQDCIFKRLDRIIVYQQLQDWFGTLNMDYLSRTGSDHAPLLLSAGEQVQQFHKHFRFLKFWLEQDSFMQVVEDFWNTTTWLTIREDIVKIKEPLFEEFPSEENRMVLQKAQAEFKKYLHFEEEIWRQKAEGEWKEDDDQIAVGAIGFYQSQFTQEETSQDCRLLDLIAPKVTREQNSILCAMPTLEELKNVVFALLGDSACGPGGFSSIFYQKCWNIVGADVYNVVKALYEGQTLPKSITHINLVLLPKKSFINTFSDLRPISLSNFINKVISRVIHDKLESVLPSLISANQSGFLKGRNIIENVLLTQELVAHIRKRGKPANVIIKLDMEKAYDRFSWRFLIQVIRRMGFTDIGVKQGDPLSPALFILTAEVLSISLNTLFDNSMFRGYGMPKWSAKLNHLSYADDTIIFASAKKESLQMNMGVLHAYEKGSGQKINTDKSAFYIHAKVATELSQDVHQISGFHRGEFPFTYLGCPIFHARRQKLFYKDMLKKVRDKLQAWKGKLLSFGGKVVLITSVLQSIPIYLLSAMVPPKCVIKELHKLFNRFFWQTKEDGRSKCWSEWEKMCFPKKEGGVGFRSLFDISKALFAKLWWRFRKSNTRWVSFIWNKYCKRFRPTVVQWKGGGSQTWKMMLQARDDMEHKIWWEPQNCSSSVWFDNWTKLGALSDYLPSQYQLDESVDELMIEDGNKFWEILVKSAWDLLRQKATISPHYEKLWIKGVSYKVSFFLWRIWFQKLPIDNVLKRMRISIVSRCCYCHIQEETMDHLFILGPLASKIWKYFAAAAGIITPLIETIIPSSSSIDHVADMEEQKYTETYKASKGNPGPSSAAFCIRNHEGDLIYAKAKRLTNITNLVVEAIAIEEGLEYCFDQQLLPVILETDSLTMKKVLDGIWEVPWNISLVVQRIQHMKKDQAVQVEHVLRDGNCLEDCFANLVFDFTVSTANSTQANSDQIQKLVASDIGIISRLIQLHP